MSRDASSQSAPPPRIIDLRYARLDTGRTDRLIDQYRSWLSDAFIERVNRYRNRRDRAARLTGRLLLLAALKDHGYQASGPLDIEYNPQGRPSLASFSLDFNISHSGEYAVCALADSARIGIDLEYVKPIDLTDFREQFTEEEWRRITGASDPTRAFYHYWTMKECVLKADGRGLTLPLSQATLQNGRMILDRREWFIEKIDLARDYACHLAVDTGDFDVVMRKMAIPAPGRGRSNPLNMA